MKRMKGYIEISNFNLMKIGLQGWIAMLLISVFFILYFVVFGDYSFSDIIVHLSLFQFIGLLGLVIAFIYMNKVIYYNEDNIIVKKLFGKQKVYNYTNIVKVKNILKDKLVIYTIDNKFNVDYELCNSKKFLKLLEEKDIHIETSTFYDKQLLNKKKNIE